MMVYFGFYDFLKLLSLTRVLLDGLDSREGVVTARHNIMMGLGMQGEDMYLYILLNIYIYPSVYLSTYLSIYLSIYPSIYPSIHLSIYLTIYF